MKILLFIMCCVVASADVIILNRSQDDCIIDGLTVVPALTDSSVAYSASTIVVGYGWTYYNSQAVSVLDGTVVVVGDNGVSSSTPLLSWAEVFLKGFFLGAVWEAFGLLIRVVRAVKSQRAEVV